ncbi:MAG TPA: carboxypeptidase-like regulatory domain-containing protein, partial [Chitinophagales bacterium]|nr:carboxypeptidase-like regulatory domain-containing protein [Chitinophagales bacterium]
MKQITLFLFCLTIGTFARAQQLTQTIRGQVTDNQSKATLPGVNIMVLNSDPILGTTSDLDGYFAIEQVPIGRVSIQATFIGYEPFIVNNLELTSGKELMLNFSMSEQVITMNEVVVRAKDDKMETNNE